MTELPLSIAMSAYNVEPYIGSTIESMLAQTFADFEFIILDDGSTDGTLRVAEQYAARDKRIRLISRENRGLIASLNEMLQLARAPLVARMDADDIAHPERLAKQMAFMEANPSCGVVGTWAHRMNEKGELRPGYLYKYPVTAEEARAHVGYESLLLHPSVMFRKELILKAGGYHRAFRHAEDFDLWLRLTHVTDICNIPEPLLTYRTHDTQVSTRHVVEQRVNAGISLHAWKLRDRGMPDPTAHVERLPKVGEIDAFFNEPGVEKGIVGWVVPQILHIQSALLDGGLPLIRSHVRHGNDARGLWRTVARLVITFREWKAGLALAAILLKADLMGSRRRLPHIA